MRAECNTSIKTHLRGPSRRDHFTLEELLGEDLGGAKKRGPTPKLQQQIERIMELPRAQQRFVMQMLDTVLAQQGR